MGDNKPVWDVIKDLLYTSRADELARIEFLVVVTAVFLLLMFLLDICSRRSRSSLIKYILLTLDAASSSMFTYTTGLMQVSNLETHADQTKACTTQLPGIYQTKGCNTQLFAAWGVLLLTLQQSISYIVDYSPKKTQNRKRSALKDIMNSFWTANLTATGCKMFELPIWLLWGLNQLRIIHGIAAFEMADRSYSHGRNSRFVADYMKEDRTTGSSSEEPDPATMEGYRYLVQGEAKQKLEAKSPDYAIRLKINDEHKFITLDKIWQCKGHLLSATGEQESKLKDLCLSFALCKLLRLKFDNLYPPPDFDDRKTRKLVFQGLLAKENYQRRAFRVIEVELAFLNDFLFTRCPIFFCQVSPFSYVILFSYIIVSLLVAANCCFLLLSGLVHYEIRKACNREAPVPHEIQEANNREAIVQAIITSFLLVVTLIKEALELGTYMLSDWAKVFLLCEYVERPSWQRFALIEKALRLWCKVRLRPWHKELHQYCLLESYTTSGMVSKDTKGRRKGTKIKLPEDVEEFIVRSLRDQSQQADQSQPLNVPSPFDLSNGLLSLQQNEMSEQLSWACRGKTHTHTILVWHIATSMCEIELSEHYDVDLQLKRISCFKSCKKIFRSLLSTNNGCFRPKENQLDEDLRSRYNVAASLSKYCAYLVVFCPDLLPDHSLATESIFKDTILKAREILRGCDSMEKRYNKMVDLGKEAEDNGEDANVIIKMGAKLYNALKEAIKEDEAKLWKVLAEFWAELVLYLAPSSNTSAHKDCLATGGEFMTHLWALVSHAGFLERPLPPQPDAGNP